jgi:hypothetical protein
MVHRTARLSASTAARRVVSSAFADESPSRKLVMAAVRAAASVSDTLSARGQNAVYDCGNMFTEMAATLKGSSVTHDEDSHVVRYLGCRPQRSISELACDLTSGRNGDSTYVYRYTWLRLDFNLHSCWREIVVLRPNIGSRKGNTPVEAFISSITDRLFVNISLVGAPIF